VLLDCSIVAGLSPIGDAEQGLRVPNMLFVQFRQQNDTLLFVWIGPRDDGDATFRVV